MHYEDLGGSQVPDQEQARSVPADAVIEVLVQSGAVSRSEVQMAAELVSQRIEIDELKSAAEPQQKSEVEQPTGGRPEK